MCHRLFFLLFPIHFPYVVPSQGTETEHKKPITSPDVVNNGLVNTDNEEDDGERKKDDIEKFMALHGQSRQDVRL